MKMNNGVKSLIAFMLGIGVGSVTTWYFVRDRYEERWREEIEEYKAMEKAHAVKKQREEVEKLQKDISVTDAPEVEEKADPGVIRRYADIVKKSGYTNYSGISGGEENDIPTGIETDPTGPVVISPYEFGDNDEYDKISLTYYSNGVLADTEDEPVENPEELIGDALEHFGEFDNDSVCVRNDARKCYCEIVRDLREF